MKSKQIQSVRRKKKVKDNYLIFLQRLLLMGLGQVNSHTQENVKRLLQKEFHETYKDKYKGNWQIALTRFNRFCARWKVVYWRDFLTFFFLNEKNEIQMKQINFRWKYNEKSIYQCLNAKKVLSSLLPTKTIKLSTKDLKSIDILPSFE